MNNGKDNNKILSNENQNIKEEESKEAIERADENNLEIQKIIENAILDESFRKNLIENPDEVLDQYQLTEISKIMIKSLSEEDFEKLTPENIEEYFSADSAIYTPDFDDSIEVDYADEDDI